MTPRCQLHSSRVTSPHHADTLEADAASGQSAHNRRLTDAGAPPAACADSNSRLRQWSNRNSQRAYVHAQCITGGVAHDHEFHPKQPTDRGAVESVARQRDCVTQTAADSEILLPLTASSDQASTAAPSDDEPSMFARAEALLLDEEIMNFQWFDTVTWDSIKDLRGTTYVQPPPRFRFALQLACHPPLRHTSRPFLTSFRASMEGSCAQQLAPLGPSCCQRLRKQLRACPGSPT